MLLCQTLDWQIICVPNNTSTASLTSVRQELQRCFILHQRPFKETSLILDVFSEHHGRLSILARGAKRPRSAFRGVLQPFSPLFLSWTGRSDLKILVDGQAQGVSYWLQGISLFTALYVNELLIKALDHHDPYVKLYQEYETVLTALANSNNDNAKIQLGLRAFESQLLAELGYALDLTGVINSKWELRIALQHVLGDKMLHSRVLVKKLLLGI